MPLIFASVACTAIAVTLRLSSKPAVVGSMEIWGLFAALAVIAAIGATVSVSIDEPDAPDQGRSSDEPAAIAAAPLPSRPGRRSIPASEVPATSPPSVERPRPRSSTLPIWVETSEDVGIQDSPEAFAPLRYDPPRSRLGRRPPVEPRVGETSPTEAIAEIDGLWRDLERLRHPVRHGATP